MVNRRKFITGVVAAGSISVAGCSSDEGDSTESTETEESSDESSTEETASGEAQFEFVEWNVPSEVEINQGVEIGVTVENTGGTAGDFAAPLYERTPDSDWTNMTEIDFGTIQPGNDVEMVFEDVVYDYVNRYELRLGDFQQTTVLQTVSAQIDWGNEYITPNGYIIRVDEPELQDSYEYEDYSGAVSQKEPDDGDQWAFVNVYVKNETGQAASSPLALDMALIYGNSQSDGDTVLIDEPTNKGEPFDGGELQPGIERSGWIAYQVPSDISTDDLTMAWSDTTFDGEIAVNWG
jgi:hypothetical protein